MAVPQNIYGGVAFEGGATESGGVEEVDLVGLSGDGIERLGRLESSAESVIAISSAKDADSVAAVSIGLVVEDGGIELSTIGRCPSPSGAGLSEACAIVVALVVRLEAAILDEVLACVTAGICHLKVALAIVGGGGVVGRNIVLVWISIMVTRSIRQGLTMLQL